MDPAGDPRTIVGAEGRSRGEARLVDPPHRTIAITRESTDTPRRPGSVVLQGRLFEP